jgi:hypothetical protein
MADIEKLMALFTEFGIGFTAELASNGTDVIMCQEGKSKIEGYPMFYTEFQFDENGKFVEMGAYE